MCSINPEREMGSCLGLLHGWDKQPKHTLEEESEFREGTSQLDE